MRRDSSFPARFGVRATFWAARTRIAATVAFLALAGLGLPVGPLYWLGVAAVALLDVRARDRVADRSPPLDAAFFTMNGVISLTFFAFVLADVVV